MANVGGALVNHGTHPLDEIFILEIDTEGHEPAVLLGAEQTLRAGAAQVRNWFSGAVTASACESP